MAETTGGIERLEYGWRVGESPKQLLGAKATIVPIVKYKEALGKIQARIGSFPIFTKLTLDLPTTAI